MAADLVSLAEFDAWLGGAVTAENDMRTAILEQVEAQFERECGRSAIPFVAAQPGRAEVRDGTGSEAIWLDYPISVLTSITLGFDHTNPTETLTVGDLLYAAGERRIVRQDGRFGCFGAPRYVKVTYNAAADLPVDAKLAILNEAARRYRARGSEEVKSETMGPYSVTFARSTGASEESDWSRAVAAHTRVL